MEKIGGPVKPASERLAFGRPASQPADTLGATGCPRSSNAGGAPATPEPKDNEGAS